jgi:type II secretory pathway pseudopilin PulG
MGQLIGIGSVRSQRGFTYLLVLFMVALMGAGFAFTVDVWVTTRQRERETELIFAGDAIRTAIGAYYNATPGAIKQYPAQLDFLLKDPRFPDTRRYLRQLYADPFSKEPVWVEIKSPRGGIMGVASSSLDAPMKRKGFSKVDLVFEMQAVRLKDKLRYRDWEFIFVPN